MLRKLHGCAYLYIPVSYVGIDQQQLKFLHTFSFFSPITVAVDQARGRKKQACCYCGELTPKLPRHMSRNHPKEEHVVAALRFPSGSTERKAMWHKLRSQGNYHHNMTVMDIGQGELIVARKPNFSGHTHSLNEFLPCPYCRGFYRRQELWKHTADCVMKPNDDQLTEIQKQVQVTSKLMLFGALYKDSRNMLNSVLATMRNDEVTLIARNDSLIMEVGKMLVEKHGAYKAQDTSQTMRELSRLLQQLRTTGPNPNVPLSNFIRPSMFDRVVSAVKTLCTFEVTDGQQNVGTPSLALKIGYVLKRCVNIVIGQALRVEDEATERSAKNFRRLLETEWSHRISHHSPTTLRKRKFNKVNVLPLAEDLDKLRKYIDLKICKSMKSLKKHPNLGDWRLLAQSSLTRLVMFNKQASELRVETYKKRPDWRKANSTEIMKSLNKFERELSKR